MTRKDFNLIAQTIASLDLAPIDRLHVAREFASALRSTNDRFDYHRFVDACVVRKEA